MSTTIIPTITSSLTNLPSSTSPTSIPSTTTDSDSSMSTNDPLGDDGGGFDNDDGTPIGGNVKVYSYFFAFVAVAILIAFLGCFGYSRRRRRLKARARSQQTDALEQDVGNWWGLGGNGRLAGLRSTNLRSTRHPQRPEGLNELGEAPPAYKARDFGEEEAESDDLEAHNNQRASTLVGDEIQVPMRTLDRDMAGLPKYDEIVKETDVEAVPHAASRQ